MRTHLSFNGYCVRIKWAGRSGQGALFLGYGRLVNPNGSYEGAQTVAVYFLPGQGYGYNP